MDRKKKLDDEKKRLKEAEAEANLKKLATNKPDKTSSKVCNSYVNILIFRELKDVFLKEETRVNYLKIKIIILPISLAMEQKRME